MANTLGDQAINAALSVANGGTNNYSYTNLQLLRYNSSGTKIESAGVTASAIHDQNTDTGTTSTTFAIDSDASTPIKIKNAGSGLLEIRNDADDGYLDLKVGNLTVSGTTTTINTETLTIDDNIIVLNNNYTGGTPTESGGVEIERGTQTNASLIWNESSDVWQCGLSGGEATIRTGTVGVTVGGTGLTSATQGDIIYASGANTLSMLAKNTSATRYLSNTGSSNNPAWAQINLANGVTGTLGVTNGGTGLATVAAGSILAANSADTISAVTSSSGTKWLRNAAGTVSWQDAPTATPGGSDTHIQFNDSGSFGGSANLTWDDSQLSVTRPTTGTNAIEAVLRLELDTTNDMAQGFGPKIEFYVEDSGLSDQLAGWISIFRRDTDTTGGFQMNLNQAGTERQSLRISPVQAWLQGYSSATDSVFEVLNITANSTTTDAEGFGARVTLVPGSGSGETRLEAVRNADGDSNLNVYVDDGTALALGITPDRSHYVYLGDAAGARKWYVYDNSATPAAVASIDSDGEITAVDLTLETVSGVVLASTFNTHSDNVCQYYAGGGGTDEFEWYDGAQNGPAMKLSIATGVGHLDIHTVDIGTDLQLATTTPGTPVDGSIYWDSASDTLKVYDGASWDDINAAPAAPGGSNTYVQFNDSSSFGGDSGLTFTKGTDKLYVAGEVEIDGNLNHDGSNVGFYGATPAAQSTSWSVTNAGSQKSLDGTSCTPAQMASALCNVIQRLLDLGLISA